MAKRLSEYFGRFIRRYERTQEAAKFMRDFESDLITDEDILRFKAGFDAGAGKIVVRLSLLTPDRQGMEHKTLHLTLEQASALTRLTQSGHVVGEIMQAYETAATYYKAALYGGQSPDDPG